ncbi:MAG: CCA tRNA nucleotidyltransferase [Minwuia sp.]|uniref:CCA tRNA nucleotidyltransferase n=1 Tax=Minwuia sp. TaxID=2493630 RepID=UPI003A8BEE37
MTPPPWQEDAGLHRIVGAIRKAGGEARLVGGCVRDWLMARRAGDLDIATTLTPDEVTAALKAARIKSVPTGIDHGTVTAVSGGRGYEVTTLRRDVETDGRHAVVSFTTDWAEDASRRDFTMNTLYADPEGTVHDPLGSGRADLEARLLRFVGDPGERIQEDYLRILRFFRFQAEIDLRHLPGESEACARMSSGLAQLSAERIWQEMRRLLAGPNREAIIRLMANLGVLEALLPEADGDAPLGGLPDGDDVLALAALLPRDAGEVVADRWKLSNADRDRLVTALAPLPGGVSAAPAELRRLAYKEGPVAVADRLTLAGAPEEIAAEIRNWSPPVFPLRGQDALDRGVAPGRQVGEMTRAVETWWLERDFAPDRDACLAELETRISAVENP